MKTKKGKVSRRGDPIDTGETRAEYDKPDYLAQWANCPGCPKCDPNDGLVLRKGSWRPTRAHEYLFQFVKQGSYYCDMEAVRESISKDTFARNLRGVSDSHKNVKGAPGQTPHSLAQPRKHGEGYKGLNPSGRNLRDVFAIPIPIELEEYWGYFVDWLEAQATDLKDVFCINPQAYPEAHYATFPEKLVEPCIKVATSEKGVCPKCGSQWARVIDKEYKKNGSGTVGGRHRLAENDNSGFTGKPNMSVKTTTLGWRPTCKCGISETVPAIVLDPFCGSGTTCAVAASLGRNYLGIELNESYIKQAALRIQEAETGITNKELKQGQQPLFSVKAENEKENKKNRKEKD